MRVKALTTAYSRSKCLHPHWFIDSTCFFPGSLLKLGDLIGYKKYDDGSTVNEKYAIRDAEIPYRFMVKFQKRVD